MSAPLLWIAVPALIALVAFFLRRWRRLVATSVAFVSLGLALLARYAPMNQVISLGPWTFTFSDRFIFAGRQFVLGETDHAILVIVYLTLAFFFVGSIAAKVSSFFVPLGLAMNSMLLASLTVTPFLYAALFIQVAILIGVPLLSPPGETVDRGVLRYLTFLSFGLPFLLFSGWMLSTLGQEELNPTDLLPALLLLGFGFAFLLAVFPLNSWIPMLPERTQPYSAVFVLTLLPLVVFTLLQRFIDQFPWLLDLGVIPILGLLMTITGGLWAAFQRDLGRLLGYAVIIEIGRSLLLMGIPSGQVLYPAMLLPRILTFGVWALSLSLIHARTSSLDFRTVQGWGRSTPLVALGVLVSNFSLAGFPLLANFAVHLSFLGLLARSSLTISVGALLGSIGLLIGALRTLAVLVMGPEELPAAEPVSTLAQGLIFIGLVAIFILGLFPQWFVPLFAG